ncbi:MAG: hypothetical protein ABMB14_39130, partial [Myxococcota bacterium]
LASALLATAAPTAALAAGRACPTDAERARFGAFRDRLAAAGTPDEAKELALNKVKVAHQAIDAAAGIVKDADGIAEADAKLDAFEAQIDAATSQDEVAAAFTSLGATAGSCDYDKVEIVIIVIGFVLGILPGILFLLLFC